MDFDTMLGAVIFIIFVAWSLAFYVSIIPEDKYASEQKAAGLTSEKVTDYLYSYVYSVPVIFESGSDAPGSVLYAENPWYAGNKSTSRVFSGSQSLDCIISGNDIYWQADLSTGKNYFQIRFSDAPGAPNCTGTFSTASAILSIPGALVREKRLSEERLNNMTNTSYEDFRKSEKIAENFRLLVNSGKVSVAYGKSPGSALDVYSERSESTFLWDADPVNLTVMIW
jgi:hypothetical protein